MQTKEFSKIFNLKSPIIQAPMAGGIVSPEFVAEVCDFGFLGSIASGYLSLDALDKYITEVKKSTQNAFQVNIFVDYAFTPAQNLTKPKELIAIEKHLGIFETENFSIPAMPSVSETIEIIIKHKVPAISTTFGLLNKQDLEKINAQNIFISTTVNSIEEAKIAIKENSPQALVFQNAQAGGHKGGFLNQGYANLDEILQLKNQHPDIYFIYTGAITDKNQVDMLLDKGLDAVQIGTGFLLTEESSANSTYKDTLLKISHADEIMHTTSITGKQAQGVKNILANLKFDSQFDYPFLHYATKSIRDFAKQNNLPEYQSLWTGTGAINIQNLPKLADYMQSLI